MRRDQIEHLADIFAHKTQVATAIRTAGPGVKLAALARRGVRHTGTTAGFAFSGLIVGGCRRITVGSLRRSSGALSRCDQQVFQREFQLFNLALDLLRGFAERLLLQPDDAQPQALDQLIMRLQRRRYLRIFRPQGDDHSLQQGGIVRKILGIVRHGPDYHKSGGRAIKTSSFKRIKSPYTSRRRSPAGTSPVNPFPQHCHLR